MTQSLIVFVAALVVTVACALAIVVALVRTRRPNEGVRTWVRDATDAWKHDELDAPDHRANDVTLDELLTDAQPASEPQRDIEGLTRLREPEDTAPPVLPSFAPQRSRTRPSLKDLARPQVEGEDEAGAATAADGEAGSASLDDCGEADATVHVGEVEPTVAAPIEASESVDVADEPVDAGEGDAGEVSTDPADPNDNPIDITDTQAEAEESGAPDTHVEETDPAESQADEEGAASPDAPVDAADDEASRAAEGDGSAQPVAAPAAVTGDDPDEDVANSEAREVVEVLAEPQLSGVGDAAEETVDGSRADDGEEGAAALEPQVGEDAAPEEDHAVATAATGEVDDEADPVEEAAAQAEEPAAPRGEQAGPRDASVSEDARSVADELHAAFAELESYIRADDDAADDAGAAPRPADQAERVKDEDATDEGEEPAEEWDPDVMEPAAADVPAPWRG